MHIPHTALTVWLCPKPVFSVIFLSYAHFSLRHLFFLKVPCSPEGKIYSLQQRPPLNNRCRRRTEALWEEEMLYCSCKKNHGCRNICCYNLQLSVCSICLFVFFQGRKPCSWLVKSFITGCYATQGYSIARQWTTWEYQILYTQATRSYLNSLDQNQKQTQASQHWTP